MLLLNVNIIGQEDLKHIHIEGGKIKSIASNEKLLPSNLSGEHLYFNGALAFPGLINSHDHLDFDLFPHTGNRIYKSYTEWGADIQSNNRKSIDAILSIPKEIRIQWGVYKNLLSGITTVVNHGEWLNLDKPVINIFQDCYSLHSLAGDRSWKLKLNRPFVENQPFVIHAGEGTDKISVEEINELIRWNLFKRKLVAVHGVSMNAQQAKAFEALIWCPASNEFLYGKTAAIDILKHKTAILFGTDSTLTASWNIWDQLRLARNKNLVTDAELFDMLNVIPAKIWNMNEIGQVANDHWADIVIAKQKDTIGRWDSFYNLNPENLLLILHHGNIRLFDAELFDQVKENNISTTEFSNIYINGIGKYVLGDLPGLIQEIRKYKPDTSFPVEFDS